MPTARLLSLYFVGLVFTELTIFPCFPLTPPKGGLVACWVLYAMSWAKAGAPDGQQDSSISSLTDQKKERFIPSLLCLSALHFISKLPSSYPGKSVSYDIASGKGQEQRPGMVMVIF